MTVAPDHSKYRQFLARGGEPADLGIEHRNRLLQDHPSHGAHSHISRLKPESVKREA
jgi:hypothetical protein